jgi:4-hydroxy-L-threonine phosphate dehydrogenase PdxA
MTAKVGQLDLSAKIEPLNRVRVAQIQRERSAVDVVTFKPWIGEGGDLGHERVDPNEPG